MNRRSPYLISIVAFGYALLYVPIISVVIYSFNDSRLVTLWGGFSLRWYRDFFTSPFWLPALKNSLFVGSIAASLATVLGAFYAIVLGRFVDRYGPRPVQLFGAAVLGAKARELELGGLPADAGGMDALQALYDEAAAALKELARG